MEGFDQCNEYDMIPTSCFDVAITKFSWAKFFIYLLMYGQGFRETVCFPSDKNQIWKECTKDNLVIIFRIFLKLKYIL